MISICFLFKLKFAEDQKFLNAAREKTQMETIASLQKDLSVQIEMVSKSFLIQLS